MIYILYGFRFLIESIFCYYIYGENEDKNFGDHKIKKITRFSSIYIALLLLYNSFAIDVVTYRFTSVFIMFAYFLIESKKNKDWRFILTYSFFINLVLESSNYIGYKINCFSMQLLGISEAIMDKSIPLFMSFALAIHFCVLLLIYKINFVKIKTIKILSIQRLSPMFFSLCLTVFLYIKYQLKVLPYGKFYNIMSMILMLYLPLLMGFYLIINKLVRLKNIDKNQIEDILTKDTISFGIPVINAVINFNLSTYEKDRKFFEKKLAKLNINHGYQGYNQMILCLAIIKHFTGGELIFDENILRYASRITRVQQNMIYNNIKNIIEKTWIQVDLEVLQKECEFIDAEDGCPEVKDFLICMAKNSA